MITTNVKFMKNSLIKVNYGCMIYEDKKMIYVQIINVNIVSQNFFILKNRNIFIINREQIKTLHVIFVNII